MRIDDLMVGDWVICTYPSINKPVKVVEIKTVSDKELKAVINNDGIRLVFRGTYIDPIPLTPEILEKNVFKKLDFSHFQIGDRRLVLDADGRWDGPLSWHWVVTEMSTNAKGQPVVLDYYVATINYVHELQHALRLCGITKEIQI
jgi:hypothetical protein